MMRELFVREGYDFDFMYDWNIRKQQMRTRLSHSSSRNNHQEEEEKNGGNTTGRGT